MKTISEIKEKLSSGDIANASKLVGITPANGSKAFAREGSKHHEDMVKALSNLITAREVLFQVTEA